MGKKVKVGMDKYEDVEMAVGDILYSDDLEGCTVFAAVWPNTNGKIFAFFAHFGAATIMHATDGPRLVERVGDDLDVPLTDGNPEKAWLVFSTDLAGNERFTEGNDRIRAMLQAKGITTVTEETYRPPQGNIAQIVELHPGKDDPLIIP
ncbi:hypothetical protein GJ744_009375 [Endocarpon pusillum]|uniref:Uncharacterized protein n=1 Tax=Endocarpon pusillum TaxID=364733 RepID=A0A8H7AJ64_9EURO|nr:hypothetical protein GJ744_009375 [Endocarpon pusillum]